MDSFEDFLGAGFSLIRGITDLFSDAEDAEDSSAETDDELIRYADDIDKKVDEECGYLRNYAWRRDECMHLILKTDKDHQRYQEGVRLRTAREEEDKKKRQEEYYKEERARHQYWVEINNERRKKVLEIPEITPLYTRSGANELNYVQPEKDIVAYCMVEVYIKDYGIQNEDHTRLIWQGVFHILLNDLKNKFRRTCYVYEEEEAIFMPLLEEYAQEIAEDAKLQKTLGYRRESPNKNLEFNMFMKSRKCRGRKEYQLEFDSKRYCKLKPLKLQISIDISKESKPVCVNIAEPLSVDSEDNFIERYRAYCETLKMEALISEQERIKRLLDKLSNAFSYPQLSAEVMSLYGQALLVVEDKIANYNKRIPPTLWGEKGEENVDYEIKWLGEKFKSVKKDCQEGEKYTILLKKEDFIDEKQEFDHILVSKHGVYLIETKYLKGKLIIKENGNWIRVDSEGEKGIASPVSQVDRHHMLVSEILKDIVDSKDIHNIICIAHASAVIEGEENSQVPIKKIDILTRYIKDLDAQASDRDYDVDAIMERLEKCKVSQK